jgi:phosphate-selective porin OprO and OprP
MKPISMLRVLLWASAMALSPSAFAQGVPDKEAEPPADAPSPDDAAALTVSADEMAKSSNDQAAKMALLEAQVEALQAQLTEIKASLTKATPSWKGAPQSVDADAGWSFKVRGRLMLDAAYAGKPANYVADRNLGFNARVRRFRIGVEGAIPGGFGYKAEVDYANSTVGFGDVILTYAPANKPFSFALGNMEPHDGMEQQTSSRWSSFIERSQMNDAFGNTRRLGLSVGVKSQDNLLRFDTGLFAAHSIDASFDNDGWIAAARGTYTPYIGPGFIHLGLNYQHREFQSNDNGVASVSTGAPSTNQFGQYRARPFLQTTGRRFVDTGTFAAKSDDIFGAELYGVFKSLHIGGEAQYVKVKSYRAGDRAVALDAFSTANTAVTPLSDPSFFSMFGEVGYFLTGETRGYKNGLWDRTKVLHPFDKGGWGAVQVIGRVDYLNLNSNALQRGQTNNFTTGVASGTANLARGGTQTGYLLGLTWIPTDYVRFLANYIHTEVKGGPLGAASNPTSTLSIDQRKYSTDSFAVRAQVDF